MVCKYLLLSCGNLDEGCKGTLTEADQRPIVRRAVALLQPSGSQQLPNKMTGKSTTLIMTIMTPMVFLVTMPILLITTVMMTDMMMTAIMAALALSMLLMMLEMSALIRPRRFFSPAPITAVRGSVDGPADHLIYAISLSDIHFPLPVCLQAPGNHYEHLISSMRASLNSRAEVR